MLLDLLIGLSYRRTVLRADFGLVRVSGKNPKQRPSRSPDTNPEYPRAALCCLVKKQFPKATFILYFSS